MYTYYKENILELCLSILTEELEVYYFLVRVPTGAMVYNQIQIYLIAYILRVSKWMEIQDVLKHIFKNDFLVHITLFLLYMS